ncbi:hypothetical protein ACI2VH_16520 [Ralstonia nicotianae]|uniref:hypothetical protein n=1 Tax=Ralstonia pseudosolanacearum TaxID=1310165 RepID=UPI0008F8EF03|nr:hypothetical protein [Ralstonia pseudosolanacearum]OIN68765.1 hypothetical protein BL248_23075 [Ralstonia solanacearum]
MVYGPVLRGNELRLFRYAMRSVAVTLVREASLHTDDFETSRSAGCDGFTLTMRQVFPGRRRDAWVGVFERGEQRLEVLGHLE